MNRKKRIIAGFLSVLMISMFCACSSGGDQSDLSGAVSGNMESSVIADQSTDVASSVGIDSMTESQEKTAVSSRSSTASGGKVSNTIQEKPSSSSSIQTQTDPNKIVPVTLPTDRVKTISQLGYTADTYRAKAVQDASYAGNAGWNVSSLAISPDYTMTVNGVNVPVYCTPVYVATGNCGALQSFAMIDVSDSNLNLSVTIKANGFTFSKAVVQPSSLGVTPSTSGQTITSTIRKYGNYTYLVCDSNGNGSQQHALVLAVRTYVDEDAEIAEYKAKYGANNVTVYDAGTHMVDYIHIKNSNSMIYLRRGSLLVMKHSMDIDSDNDNQNKYESGAASSNGWGMKRYPVMTVNNKNNIQIVGRGTIDGGQLDWHERRGIMASNCYGFTIDGINIVNFP